MVFSEADGQSAISARPQGGSTGQPEGRPDRPPLSFAQRALWLLDRIHPESSLYNVPVAVRLHGELDVEGLRRALTRVTERHEALRTVFPSERGEPYQRVLPAGVVPLSYVDLRDRAPDVREREARTIVDGWAAAPFDLACDGPLRAGLIRLADQDHVLGLVLHHIACDGQSLHLLFDELGALYGGDGELAPLDAQFVDYATRQRDLGVDGNELSWWREHLTGAPTSLALPTDHPRPASRSGRGATHTVRLPAALVAASTALAGRIRATPFVVMVAAYAALLGRLTGSREVIVGTPVEGRSEERYERVIGFFVNTVPLRIDLSGNPGFGELARRVRSTALDAVEHAGVPFEALVDGLRLDRDLATLPLVQAILTFEPRPIAEPRLPGLRAEALPLFTEAAKFDLDVMIMRTPDDSGDFDLSVTYNTDLFDADTIAAFAQRFMGVLAAGTTDPALPLHRLPVLTAAESLAATAQGDGVSDDPDDLVPVHVWVRRHAARRPAAIAVSAPTGALSYAELNRHTDALAHRLVEGGARTGEVIGVLLPRGTALVTAMLGVLRSGAAYLPLDLTHPTDHLQGIIRAAGVRQVLTDPDNASRLRGMDVETMMVRTADGVCPEQPGPRSEPHPDDLAYVIFTSGSTGEPKGVGVPHRALTNHTLATRDGYGLRPGDRVLQFANTAFDVAAEELFPSWAAGACVVLCEQPPAPEHLTGHLDAQAVTVANLPASYWQRWAASIGRGDTSLPRTLRLLIVGSEPVDPSTVRDWYSRSTVPLVNAYGLTETTITSLTGRISDPVADPVPVGSPIAGVRAYVLDEHLNLVPPGVPGELYIGGAGLARGYLGQPDLTAARFLPDPFAPLPGARMHRTGDLARRRHDGAIEVLGRIDAQLKVRGHRVEPSEVEAALCAHPDVVQAAVAAKPGHDGIMRLAAYVVTHGGAVAGDLRRHLTARLPVYLIPDSITCLPHLPTLPSGKIDRAALPDPEPATARPVGQAFAGTETERFLAETWQDVLALDRVGVDDNFFDLGGTSFTLAAVHARLCEHIGRKLPMVTLYEYPTIAALAAHLTDGDGAGSDAAAQSIDRLQAARVRLQRRRLRHR